MAHDSTGFSTFNSQATLEALSISVTIKLLIVFLVLESFLIVKQSSGGRTNISEIRYGSVGLEYSI